MTRTTKNTMFSTALALALMAAGITPSASLSKSRPGPTRRTRWPRKRGPAGIRVDVATGFAVGVTR